jgi:hypothetical protein
MTFTLATLRLATITPLSASKRVSFTLSGETLDCRYISDTSLALSLTATTLRVAINHLMAQDMEVKHGIIDAGHCSEINIKNLCKNNTPSLIRLPNKYLAKQLINEHLMDICDID